MQPISTVGFPHDSGDYQTRPSLACDFEEPFRWISGALVFEAFESGVLDLPDFYFTGDDYRYHFEPEAKRRFLDTLRERFNSAVRYKGRAFKWDIVIEQKTVELGRFLIGGSTGVNFSEPCPSLCRNDNRELRKQVLSLSQSETRKLGIGKGTLHHLRDNARSERSFKLYHRTLGRLEPKPR